SLLSSYLSFFFFLCYADLLDPLSFPTRRSSDLAGALSYSELGAMFPEAGGEYVYLREAFGSFFGFLTGWASFVAGKKRTKRFARSEEHTSELQSRVDLVCRLLLEKKKLHHVAVL